MLILFNVNNLYIFIKILYLYNLKNMSSFKLQMRKYLSIICITLSVICLAQFRAENEFDNNNQIQSNEQQSNHNVDPNDPTQVQSAPNNTFNENEEQNSNLVPNGGEHPEGPGNPGEPVPINSLIPVLLLSGMSLMIYYQRKNKKTNI
ncbi:hypothetical protein SAMN05421679_106155 [Epilithonimonas pallida]|uniref:PEP-CTERM protein-sorting domain-containing protein n=1 Tax=Epilithonimonas pallida TaxID=373671 RepID=A0ABY1R6L9_9FLAO|nr:hypothetical protein SAMN05421679_106155 [Epilithonimonas pallida]